MNTNDRDDSGNNNIIMGRNAVREALKNGRSIERILVVQESTDGSMREILRLAKDRNMVVRNVSRQKLDELCMPFGYDGRPGNHQGIVAQVPEKEYCSLEDLLNYAKQKGEEPFVLLLDSIQDPHNLGAIIRSAECMGVHGIVVPKRRSAPLNAAAYKASAGALEYMRVARVTN
ncbi:RNA methyltransferase, partial [Clostridia bacterium OttesenSCG-928-F22]|nr:RNA methyltransferase [Clostridia bacterium OttesenSCG-928-F22]